MLTVGIANKVAGNLADMLDGSGVQPYFVLMVMSIVLGVMLLVFTPMFTRMFGARDAAEPASPQSPESALA